MTAAERVRAAAEEQAERERAGRAEVARLAAEREHDEAVRRVGRDDARRRHEQRQQAARDALQAVQAAVERLDRIERRAQRALEVHAERHELRGDRIEAGLDAVIGRVDAAVQTRAAEFALALSAPARLEGEGMLARAVELARLADVRARQGEIRETLLPLLVGDVSPLSTGEYEAQRERARTHLEVIKQARADAGRHAEAVGDVTRRLDSPLTGDEAPPDAAEPAAQVLDLGDLAEREFAELQAALSE